MNRTVGILGSGQLAMLFCAEAASCKLKTVVLSTSEQDPAAQVADQVVLGHIADPSSVNELARLSDWLIFENGWVPAAALVGVEKSKFFPSIQAMLGLRNKLSQKKNFN